MSAGVLHCDDSRIQPGTVSRPGTTIGIVEDNAGLGAILRRIVDSTPECRCVGVWQSGEEAVSKASASRPDIVLMDLRLPGISGVEATARLKAELPEVLIMVATIYNDHDEIFDAVKAGACGYLLKRASPADVRQAIQAAREGGAPMSAEIARRVVEVFRQPLPPVAVAAVNLSERETEILEMLTQGLADDDIAHQLGLNSKAVREHFKRIYEKLHRRSDSEVTP